MLGFDGIKMYRMVGGLVSLYAPMQRKQTPYLCIHGVWNSRQGDVGKTIKDPISIEEIFHGREVGCTCLQELFFLCEWTHE